MPKAVRFVRRAVWVTTPLGIAIMCLSIAVTRSSALFALGAISAVSGWISLYLYERQP